LFPVKSDGQGRNYSRPEVASHLKDQRLSWTPTSLSAFLNLSFKISIKFKFMGKDYVNGAGYQDKKAQLGFPSWRKSWTIGTRICAMQRSR
jgi:hypothetical protein